MGSKYGASTEKISLKPLEPASFLGIWSKGLRASWIHRNQLSMGRKLQPNYLQAVLNSSPTTTLIMKNDPDPIPLYWLANGYSNQQWICQKDQLKHNMVQISQPGFSEIPFNGSQNELFLDVFLRVGQSPARWTSTEKKRAPRRKRNLHLS